MLAERAECQSCQLEVLASERDADDGNTEHKACEEPEHRQQKSPQKEPENIADDFHKCTSISPERLQKSGYFSHRLRCLTAS